MNYHQSLNLAKLEQVMADEKKYPFPEYFKIIRLTLGYSRDQVASFIDCSPRRIVYLEAGKYGVRGPDASFITSISNFYSQQPFEMLKKFQTYMDDPNRPLIPSRSSTKRQNNANNN